MLCLRKYKEGGIVNALFDAPGRGRNAEITDEKKRGLSILPVKNQLILDTQLKHGLCQADIPYQ